LFQFHYNLLPNYLQITVLLRLGRQTVTNSDLKLNFVDIYKLLNYPNNFLMTSALETSRILLNSFIIA